jgi:predicted ATPase
MNKIRIKEFGPIKQGLQDNEGWIDIKKVTVFIGDQGAGKSTVAKLISTLVWIEKALVRGDFDQLSVFDFQEHCAYQNIGSYFRERSEIQYQGNAYLIKYNSRNVTIEKNENNGYSFPKIMYVPAERNLVSAVVNVNDLKGLPRTLYTFSDEYTKAINDLDGSLKIPLKGMRVEYDRITKVVYLTSDEFSIKLSEASSGFQSFIPLFLVSGFLANSLHQKTDKSIKTSSIEEDRRLRKRIQDIMLNPNLTEEVKQGMLEVLSAELKYSAFINIVEEPEQNLFPTSQRQVLNTLLGFNNQEETNKIVITTHSPYLINYLTLAVKAESLSGKVESPSHKKKLDAIVPYNSHLKGSDLIVYEFTGDGKISKLKDHKGMPSDDNELNYELGETNELFAQLLEIQQRL